MTLEHGRSAAWLSAVFALAAIQGCSGSETALAPAPTPAPVPVPAPATVELTCDDTMKAGFKPDANTTVVFVKAFKAGDSLALTGTPASPLPPTAGADLCLVKMIVGPGFEGAASAPSTSAGIGIEVWLPTPTGWNERIKNLGGGGWAGGSHTSATLIGNVAAATTAATAEILTDRAVLPRARWVMTLLKLPPGQHATKSMAASMAGGRWSASVASHVATGSSTNCGTKPTTTFRGAWATRTKSAARSSSATENTMTARTKLRAICWLFMGSAPNSAEDCVDGEDECAVP